MTSITKFYERIVSHQYYGGNQFESTRVAEERSFTLQEPSSEKLRDELAQELFLECKRSVEKQVAQIIDELKPSIPKKPVVQRIKGTFNSPPPGKIYCKERCGGWCDLDCDNCPKCGTDEARAEPRE